jgi:diguanylate cyclase (GGDEF)-like protein/PAS domain S-box-containing protein
MGESLTEEQRDNILIVEDEGIVALHLERQLLEAGYHVAGTCGSGEDAIRKVEILQPDLVLMDIHLDGRLDGIDAARTIHERWRIPVVFITAFADDATLARARTAIPYGYLVKPFKPLEIHATICMALTRHKADQAVAVAEARHRLALEAGGLADWEYSRGRLVCGGRLAKLFGVPPTFLNEDWKQFIQLVHVDDRPALEAAVQEALVHGRLLHMEFRGLRKGEIHWFEAHAQVHGPAAQASIIGVVRDITERRAQETRLKEAAAVFAAAGEAITVTDCHGRFLSVNPAFESLTGFTEAEIVGSHWDLVHTRRESDVPWAEIFKSLKSDGRWQGETPLTLKNGGQLTVWQFLTPVPDINGIHHYVSIFTDLGALQRAEDRLAFLAHHDPMTGLPNRLLFQERLARALTRRNSECALIFLDLDSFKLVNDTLGHSSGDFLLQTVATRICTVLRKEDTVARFGGDEFVVLIERATKQSGILRICEAIRQALLPPVDLAGQLIEIGASLGVAISPRDGENPQQLLKAADTALYTAKAAGKGRVCFYEIEMTRQLSERLRLKNDMRHALDRGEFQLRYQPQIALVDGRVTGFEVLLRWHHPALGILTPGVFINIAEEDDFILPLGRWIFSQAAQQARAWVNAGFPVRVAVNCSVRELAMPAYVSSLRTALMNNSVAPESMEIEITEGSLHDLTESGALLRKLKDLGIGIAVDDFGVGYSSLAALKYLPIDRLKVDQTFMEGIPDDPACRRLFGGIIRLGHSLNLRVCGEGVETKKQLDFLRREACCEAQGYYIARPMDAAAATLYLSERAA